MARDKRRLAAIVCADVAGFSRLMGVDEAGTLTTLKSHLHALFEPKISEYGGRIVKTTGDGVLVEFTSAQEAVRCAINIQTAMVERERASAPDTRIVYRFGINLGDVIFDDRFRVHPPAFRVVLPRSFRVGHASNRLRFCLRRLSRGARPGRFVAAFAKE